MADLLVIIHLGFVAFVVFGGLLVLVRRWWMWLHLPALAWGAAVEVFGLFCPLTVWEQQYRTYDGGFIERYVLPVLYPEDLTRPDQYVLAALLVLFNAGVYTAVFLSRKSRSGKSRAPSEN